MTNNGAVSKSLNCGGSYTIPAGYHNGSGKVTANSLASQTSGTAGANEILKGEIAWVNGVRIAGTMPNLSNSTTLDYTSSNTTPVIEGDACWLTSNSDGTSRVCIRYAGMKSDGSPGVAKDGTDITDGFLKANTLFAYPASNFGNATAADVLSGKTFTSTAGVKVNGTIPTKGATTHTPGTSNKTAVAAGTYCSGAQTVKGDSNLKAANIKKGVSIFGVAGSLDPIISEPTMTVKCVEMDAVDWYNTYGAWYHKPYATETIDGIKSFRYYYYGTYNSSSDSYSIDNGTCFKFPSDCTVPLKLEVTVTWLSFGQTLKDAVSNIYYTGDLKSNITEWLNFSWVHSFNSSGATTTYTGTAKDNYYYFNAGVRYNCSTSNTRGTALSSDKTASFNTMTQAKKFNGFWAGNSGYNKYNSDGAVSYIRLYYI
jgi:hypothetical protein